MANGYFRDLSGLYKSPPKLAPASLDMGHNPQLGVYKKQWVTKLIGTPKCNYIQS